MAYRAAAIDMAYGLFCQGLQHEEIEKRMKAVYPSWSRQLLYGPDGWILRYNWDDRRAKADAKKQELTDAIENTEELIVRSLTAALGSLSEKIASQGSQVDAADLAQLNKLSGTLDKVRARMERGGGGDRATLFLEFLGELITFLKERDAELAGSFEAYHLDEFIERIKG